MFGITLSTVISWTAIYLVAWWITLFAILPIGVRSQHEDGQGVPGSDPGAPVKPELGRKALMTTVVSFVVVVFIYVLRRFLD